MTTRAGRRSSIATIRGSTDPGEVTPGEFYAPSRRAYGGLPPLSYTRHDFDVLVTACGRIRMHRKKIHVSTVLAGQGLGIEEVD